MAAGTARTNLVPTGSTYYGTTSGDLYSSDANSRFIPAIYSKKVLRNFYAKTVFADICNTDYQGEIKKFGDTVYIRNTPNLTVSAYTVGATLTYNPPQENATSMAIDRGKYVAFKIDDVDAAQSDLPLQSIFAGDAAKRLNISVDTEILAYLYTEANSSNYGSTAGVLSSNIDMGASAAPVVVTASNAVDKIVEMNQVLDEQNIDSEGRYAVLPPWYCAQLKLGDLRRADVTGDATGVIRNGLVGMVDRTKLYMNNNLNSTTDGTTGNTTYYITFGTKEASTFAAQVEKTETVRQEDSFGMKWRTLLVYGRKVVQPTALGYMYAEKG
jgi:hypothetical protein